MRKGALLTASLLLPAAMAFSAGFQINVQGVRQLAMGGTGVATPWDVSTLFYNPAGLSSLRSMQAYGSVSFLLVRTSYVQTPTYGYREDAKPGFYTPFNLYVGGPLRQNDRIGVGIGIYTPFGSGITWDDNWEGKFVTQSVKLQSFFIQPTVSYKISDAVSIGAGFVYALGKVELNRALPVQDASGRDATASLEGGANGIGFNAGIQVRASESIRLGLTYRSQVNMEVDKGDATFNVPSSLRPNFPNTSFSSELPLPSVTTLGIAYKPIDDLTLQFDVNYVGWSAYKSLKFDYEHNTSVLQDTEAPRNYENKATFRLGAHYMINDRISVMAGGAYDPTPVADNYVSPDLPDANHWTASAGATFRINEQWSALGALEYNTTVKRNSVYLPDNFAGRYQTKVLVPSIGVTYDF